MNTDGWISAKEAAQQFNVNYSLVTDLALRQKIEATKVASNRGRKRKWIVNPKSLSDYLEQPHKGHGNWGPRLRAIDRGPEWARHPPPKEHKRQLPLGVEPYNIWTLRQNFRLTKSVESWWRVVERERLKDAVDVIKIEWHTKTENGIVSRQRVMTVVDLGIVWSF